MLDINKLPSMVGIGNQSEGDFRTIEFDISSWLSDYPDGVIGISYRRPTEKHLWPATGVWVDYESKILRWTIGEHVMEIPGSGDAVIRLAEGDAHGRSARFIIVISPGHWNCGPAPEPSGDWVNQVIGAAQEAKNEAQRSVTAAQEAKGSLTKLTTLDVSVSGLNAGEEPTVERTETETGVSLEFSIPSGEKGDKGDPLSFGDLSPEQKNELRGMPGHTPVKGTDYWTPEEAAEMQTAKDNATLAAQAAQSVVDNLTASTVPTNDAGVSVQDELSQITGMMKKDDPVNRLNLNAASDGYMDPSGIAGSNPIYRYTDHIRVNEGDVVKGWRGTTSVIASGLRFIAAYDARGIVIPTAGMSTEASVYTVPAGVASIRVTYYIWYEDILMICVNADMPSAYSPYHPSRYIADSGFVDSYTKSEVDIIAAKK